MRIIVAGAGNVGAYVAAQLLEAEHQVVVIDNDPDRIDHLDLPGAELFTGDACEPNQLARTDPGNTDVLVAVTGDDEDNLVMSLLAKQEFGVPRVIARVNNPANEWMFDARWGVDLSVSTPHLLTALVQEAVSVGSLVRLLSFEQGKAALLEITLAEDATIIGREIAEAGFPRDSTVVAILRRDHVVVPRGDTTFAEGDEVLVLVTPASEPDVRALLTTR